MRKSLMNYFAVIALLVAMIPKIASASEFDSSDYDEYNGYIEQGILDPEITFQDWNNLRDTANQLERLLEQSNEFESVYDSRSATSYSMRAGDIFITNGTSSAGITGHAGIAISTNYILHIAGVGYHPASISLSSWHEEYTNKTAESWTKVYRHSNASIANEAAQWADENYSGSSASYFIDYDLESTSTTYCSKIVWQAYFFGANSATYLDFGLVLPYQLPGLIHNISLNQTFS